MTVSRSGRRGDRVRARSPRRGPLLLPPATATGGQLQVEIIGGGGIRRCDGMEERTRRRDLVCVDEHGNANAAVEEEEERTAPPENESEMEATPLSLSPPSPTTPAPPPLAGGASLDSKWRTDKRAPRVSERERALAPSDYVCMGTILKS